MPHLLIVHHTPSPHCQEMFEAVLAGATDPEIAGVEVVRRPALTVSATDMLEADGYLLCDDADSIGTTPTVLVCANFQPA